MNLVAWHWYAGWSLILAGFLVGGGLGLNFHHADFLGGYGSFQRRLVRLGHIALIALGLFNVVCTQAIESVGESGLAVAASAALLVGSVAMPLVCFLTAWRPRFRFAFALPVLALVSAVVLLLIGGPR